MIIRLVKQAKSHTKSGRHEKHSARQSFLVVSLLALMMMALTGCSNTLHGMGQDIERAGETIQNTF